MFTYKILYRYIRYYKFTLHSVLRQIHSLFQSEFSTVVFLNRWAAARYRALASIIPGRERSEETTICYKISLVQLITNLNVILYLSTCHTIYGSVLILFMIMPSVITNTYVSLMYELRKIGKYLRVNLLGPGPRLIKKEFTGPRSHKVWETLTSNDSGVQESHNIVSPKIFIAVAQSMEI